MTYSISSREDSIEKPSKKKKNKTMIFLNMAKQNSLISPEVSPNKTNKKLILGEDKKIIIKKKKKK